MIPLLERDILPYLKRLAGKSWLIRSRVIKIAGLAESQVNGRVKDLLELRPPVTVGIYAKLGEVDLKIMAKDKSSDSAGKRIARIENIIRKRLGRYIFGSDDETLEGAVGRLLIMKKKTLAIAESCTGGLVANRITDIAGSSRYFMTGVVAYSNSTKIRLLGVSAETLRRYGAVSKKTALEMAKGVRLLASADIGIGITGIAGPAGGTRPKPVGLVYIAFSTGKINLVKECRFKGARDEIKFQASQVALDILRRNSDL
jgi:nicotinamide-nucleotide amidase